MTHANIDADKEEVDTVSTEAPASITPLFLC